MSEAKLVARAPTADELLALRRAAAWLVPDRDAAAVALRNTIFAACVEEDGACVGCGRVVGDGALVFHIQDLIVLPEHQRKGYGTLIMDAVMDYIHGAADPCAFIALFAAPSVVPWYKRHGFVERPHGRLGPGMVFSRE